MNVGADVFALPSSALLPAGCETNDHEKPSGSPSASLEPEPSSCTSAPSATLWSGPASATGGVFSVLMDTLSGRLASWPSSTTSVAT